MQASNYLEIDEGLIPTGSIKSVKGTLFDFTEPHTIGERANQVAPRGYDHCFVLEPDASKYRIDPNEIVKAVEVFSPLSGIKLTMSTTEPAFQFYIGSQTADGLVPKKSQSTDSSVKIGPFSGFCLEAQRFPDAVNKEQWKNQVILTGDKPYNQITIYKFEINNNRF